MYVSETGKSNLDNLENSGDQIKSHLLLFFFAEFKAARVAATKTSLTPSLALIFSAISLPSLKVTGSCLVLCSSFFVASSSQYYNITELHPYQDKKVAVAYHNLLGQQCPRELIQPNTYSKYLYTYLSVINFDICNIVFEYSRNVYLGKLVFAEYNK
ncbi:Rho GTPase, putative [Schistosoma mansoni]|uniref:Rho GTPase, putative n=1 Tax=Schistosoma mansoni TaxID=6183 RepID=UPI00022C8357|nr:Rho GTPase, putative [Schistosoma mansoni]|eukprot:XP_018647417.1 Rho GTPase, putative [Schistosoma mansoni]